MADFSIEQAISMFASHGVQAAYLVPTENALKKSIIDAHAGIRVFLKDNHVHDFELQGQGNEEHGVKVEVNLVGISSISTQQMSLYRPKTKEGDPRLWTNLNGYAKPNNLLAFFIGYDGKIYVANCSDRALFESNADPNSPLGSLLSHGNVTEKTTLLLDLLKEICSRGWVDATRAGDTAVGHTLETLLGIEANSSKRPDFLDEIELKSARMPRTGRASNKSTMLSKVPNWKKSKLTALGVLNTYGEVSPEKNRRELYVTVSDKPNRQGLYLQYEETSGLVECRFLDSENANHAVVLWQIEDLQKDLQSKHKETFWVKAERRIASNGNEQFRYHKATRTQRPMVQNIGPLINAGIITLDFTLSEKASGGVRDHGYLFRIWPKDLGLLFPAVETFDLEG